MQRDSLSFSGMVEDAPRISPWVRHKDRVCAFEGCDTLLSIYNSSTFCWHHETSRVFALPGPQQRSRRRKEGSGSGHRLG
jgi:hypothetical protein